MNEHTYDGEQIDKRLIELEIKSAYADDLLEQLNQVIVRQQQQIDLLIREVTELRQQSPEGGAGTLRRPARRIATALLT